MSNPKQSKDPKKVKAGRKGGKLSPSNFKRNNALAVRAGQRSAWIRNGGKLKDMPPEFLALEKEGLDDNNNNRLDNRRST